MANMIIAFAVALTALAPESGKQVPTIEQAEADPNYERAPSRMLKGQCAAIDPLADILRKKDDVAEFWSVNCDYLIFSSFPEDEEQAQKKQIMGFVNSKDKSGTYFRGRWTLSDKNSSFNITEISQDQITWISLRKGLVRLLLLDPDNSVLFVGFGVFGDDSKRGVAFEFKAEDKLD